MHGFFLACALFGGAVLVLQLVLGATGGHDGAHDAAHASSMPHAHAGGAPHAHGEGLSLFSVRSLTAAIAFFGAGGLATESLGGGNALALVVAVLLAFAAMLGVAWTMRAMTRLEDDGTIAIAGAIGTIGIVYLTIPGARSGSGKIHLTLQNRTVELQAVTPEAMLPTGTAVLVVDVVGPDTVVVVPNPVDLLVDSEASHVG